MSTPELQSAIERLGDMFAAARRIVPFTGAGISTESGIPDFRSPGGFWTQNKPIPFDAFLASKAARSESWRRRFLLGEVLATARPGRGHLAIAQLWRAGRIPGVITQNIDGLHQAAGLPEDVVVELHGSTMHATCLDCGQRYEITRVKERFDATGHAPDCDDCGGFIKTATVSFGQSMPPVAMARAEELARTADLFVVIGSSLVVWPAAGFPLAAKRHGAALVIVNREPTEFDEMADLVVRGDIGTVFSPFAVADGPERAS